MPVRGAGTRTAAAPGPAQRDTTPQKTAAAAAAAAAPQAKEFDWDKKSQGVLLSAFFWGCAPPSAPRQFLPTSPRGWARGVSLSRTSVLELLSAAPPPGAHRCLAAADVSTNLFGSLLAQKFGAKRVVMGSMALSCALQGFMPAAAAHSLQMATLVRALTGVVQARPVAVPAAAASRRWQPRGRKRTRARLQGARGGGRSFGSSPSVPLSRCQPPARHVPARRRRFRASTTWWGA